MSQLQQYYAFSQYNQLMNDKIYSIALSRLTAEQRAQDKHAFFKSLHATLEHILIADLIWLRRLQNVPALQFLLTTELVNFPSISNLQHSLYPEFNELWQSRQRLDAVIDKMVHLLTPEIISTSFCYHDLSGTKICNHLWVFLSHFFNHQTHHRGQVTTLLAQFNLDIGITDFHLLVSL